MVDRVSDHRDSLLVALLEDLLAEQRDVTAVARFSAAHDEAERTGTMEALATGPGGRYQSLIPLSAPLPTEQFAFEVNLDACTGCKACVTGCTNLNGLDADEAWRTVGRVGHQHVTSACHHCADAACMTGCPANAYTKDLFSGAVVHLDDACIGCGYCTMTCPYEVPVMNQRLGIVRKCDMCHDRLAEGEAPACVQACPTEAIRITIVERGSTDWALGAGPDPALTAPSTRFIGRRTTRALPPAVRAPVPAHGHPALAALLVLSQTALGAMAMGYPLPALGFVLAAATASVSHLGRPLLAWRAVLGWRRSWLSREVLAIAAAAPLTALAALASMPHHLPEVVADLVAWRALVIPLRIAASLALAAAVGCSAAVYVVTRRAVWRAVATVPRFALTAAAAAAVLSGVWWTLAIVVAAQFGLEAWSARIDQPVVGTLLAGPLSVGFGRRVVLGVMAVALAPFSVPAAIVVLVAAGLIERGLWFRAVPSTSMPR